MVLPVACLPPWRKLRVSFPTLAEDSMSNCRYALTAVGLVSVLSAHAGADDRFKQFLSLSLEELMQQKVTISTHSEQVLSKAPSAVTVITADDIKATGTTNLAEVLQTVPGIHVKYQQFANRPLISFRGASDKQTLLMVNGAPMSDLMWRQGIFWKGLATSGIERVEIIRGPGSALFGTDASVGVINVITKTAGRLAGSEAGLRLGSFDTQTAWMQYGGEWSGFDVAMTVDVSHTAGPDPLIVSDAQTGNDLLFATNASLAPGHADFGYRNADLRLSVAREQWRLNLDYTRHDDLETGMTGAGALDAVTEGKDSRFDVALIFADEQFSDDWGLNAELRYRHIDYSSGDGFQEWPPGFTDATGTYPEGVINRMRSAERSVSGEVSGQYRGIEHHALTLGAGFRWQDIYRVEQWVNSGVDGNGNPLLAGGPLVDLSDTPYAFAPEKDRTARYLYLQDIWALADDWELTAGARYDHHSDFGGSLNPRLALVWHASDRLTTKLLYGQAFRAPYFQELFTETSFSLPNPDLDPERSETLELSFSYMLTRDLRLAMNLYRLEQRDIISTQTVPGLAKPRYQNTGDQTTHGMELETWWQASEDVRLYANYAYNDPDDGPFRDYGRPQQQAYLRADWRFLPNWHWNAQANWIGERERTTGDSRPTLDDDLVADSTLRYTGIRDWELALSIRNVFDAHARDFTRSSIPDDLPLPARSVFVEARYDLDRVLR